MRTFYDLWMTRGSGREGKEGQKARCERWISILEGDVDMD